MCLSFIEFFCPVVISMISMPKLYISDRVEISPLYRYSGAIYPLESMNVNVIVKIMGDTNAIYSVIRKPNNGMPTLLLNLLCSHNIYCVYSGLFFTKESRQAEIRNFWHHVIIQQYVGRLKIQMNDRPISSLM